jgi:hypothetical protein
MRCDAVVATCNIVIGNGTFFYRYGSASLGLCVWFSCLVFLYLGVLGTAVWGLYGCVWGVTVTGYGLATLLIV